MRAPPVAQGGIEVLIGVKQSQKEVINPHMTAVNPVRAPARHAMPIQCSL